MEGNNNTYQQYQPNNRDSNSYSYSYSYSYRKNSAIMNNFGMNVDSNMDINTKTRNNNNNSNKGNSWNNAAASVSTNHEYSSDQIAALSTGFSLVHKVAGHGIVGSSDETTNTNIDSDIKIEPTTVSSDPVQMMQIDSEAAKRAWARELYEMSSDTREAINYELHGVASRAVPEDPAVLAEALILLQIEIETRIPAFHKQAHIQAMGLKSNYVQTPAFRLRFLRAERFDIKKAAIRYCRGLDYLVKSFGEQALLRQLYLSDLSKEEERFLKKGLKQILPTRDRFGRRLMAHCGSYSNEHPCHLRAKVVTYLCFGVLAEDVTTQRNGVVSIGFFSEGDNDLLAMERKCFLRFFEAVPLRWSGFHLCIPNNPANSILIGLMLTVIPKDMRRITRVHSGTNLECEYSLRSFGIPTEDIPRTCTGKIKTKYLAKWMRVRTAMDDHRRMMAQNNYNSYYAQPPSLRVFPGIECPEVNCVLFRLAGLASSHPGNVEFRLFLQDKEGHRQQLQNLRQKDDYLHQIIEETAMRGFRFLVFDENRNWYNEITEYKVLRKHIFQAQRDIGKRAKARAAVQLTKSNTAVFTSLGGSMQFSKQACQPFKKNKK